MAKRTDADKKSTAKGTGWPKTFPWKWLLVYLLVVAAVVTGGCFFLRYLQGDSKRRAQEELAAIADLKADQIQNWRRERLGDAEVAVGDPFFVDKAREFIADPSREGLREDLLAWVKSRLENYDYQGVFLLDRNGEAVLSVPEPGEPLGSYARGLAKEAMADGAMAISDLHYGEDEARIHIDLVGPIPPEGAGGLPAAGALLLRIDPYHFLYPLIQSWPTPSGSAETELVRREGDEVVYLNELRHLGGTALSLRLPVSEEQLPAAMAARGQEGVVEGRDYRGVDVLAAIRAVPDSPWYIIAKKDTDEIYSPIRLRSWLAVGLTALLVLALGLLFAFLWTRRQSQFYRTRYELEAELAERELFLRRLTDNMLDLTSQIDTEGYFVYLSPSNQTVLGYKPEDLLGTHVIELVHPDDLAVVAEAYATSTERLVPGKAEFRARHADGHYIWVESVGNPLFDEEGELIGAIFVTRDISKRKRAEERLERLNRCFLELGTDPLENITMIVDAGREILEAAHMHYSRMEKGRLHSYLTSTDDRGFKVIDRPEGLICQTTIGEGREGPVAIEDITVFGYENFAPEIREEGFRSYLGYPIKIDGRTVGCLGLFRREAGGFSGQETDLLGMLARAIILEEERLAHLEELRDFIDIASHELRHPMTVIKGYAATLRSYLDRMDEKTREEVLDDIDKSVDRMERLVRQLLDTARIERGKLTVKKTAVDMAALLERVVREVREMREGVPAGHISLLVSKDLDRVEADPERIARVLVILIENAVNYSPGGSPVEVEAAPVGEKGVMIAVLDRGWGVPEDERERIFERFFQVEEAVHHSKPGIGLGLYIAREIVEAHGGKIWCEPREGGGSIFRFTLP